MSRTFAFALTAAALLAPSAAFAETGAPLDAPPPCTWAEPALPTRIPANTPGIPIRGHAIAASVVASDGTPIATTLGAPGVDGWGVLALSTSLVAGTSYALEWTDECNGKQTRRFDATGVSALPTAAGTLSATPRSEALPCDAAGLPTGMAYADVYLAETAELAAFRDLVAVDLSAEGAAVDVTSTQFGRLQSDGYVGHVARKCPYGDGVLQVTAHVRIPGGATLATAPLTVTVPCPTTCYGPTSPPADAGGTDTGTTATPAGVSSGGPGCSSAPGAAGAAGAAGVMSGVYAGAGTLAIATCAGLLRRRRARRSTRR